MEGLHRLSRWISRSVLAFAAASLVAMTVIIAWQVFARYVLNASPAWAEQAALVILMWLVMTGAAVGVREGFHIAIVAGLEAAPERLRRWMSLAIMAVTLAFSLTLLVFGAELVGRMWNYAIPTLGLSRGAAYLALPLSGALMAFFSIERILADLRGTKVEPLWR